MKILLVDFSPVTYRWIFSSTTNAIKNLNLKKDENGLYNFNEYKDIYFYKLLDDLSKFKQRFQVDEIVLAIDSKPYWREKYWSGYKHGRFKDDKSGINWKQAKDAQQEIIDILDKYSSFKVLKVPGVEGDDILFTLSKYLTPDNEIICKSVDHDIAYTLLNENVKFWKTSHTHKTKESAFVNKNQEELEEEMLDHCFFGDKGDYILSINAYTIFSNKFKEVYPDMTPEKAYSKRHEIDLGFTKKYGESAYKHPRFGKKSFMKKIEKEGKDYRTAVKDYLKINPIHKWNFELNKKIALPNGIPDEIKQEIIAAYENASNVRDITELNKWFMQYNMVNLIGITGLL
jgi:hypothetical protein